MGKGAIRRCMIRLDKTLEYIGGARMVEEPLYHFSFASPAWGLIQGW
jgi:hypothetical protein